MTYSKKLCNNCKKKLKLSTSLSSNTLESKGDTILISNMLHAGCKPLIFSGQSIDVVNKEGCFSDNMLVAQLFLTSPDSKFRFLFTFEFKDGEMEENGINWIYENLKFKGIEFSTNLLKLYFKETNYIPIKNYIRTNSTFIHVDSQGFYLRAKYLVDRLISMAPDQNKVNFIPADSKLEEKILLVSFKNNK